MHLKKLGIFTVILIVIIGATSTWYTIAFGGTSYYVTIQDDGVKQLEKQKERKGKPKPTKLFIHYKYNEEAYTENGKEKKITFESPRNLRHGAYLKLTYNYKKVVTTWKEVKKSEVPQKALDNLKMEEP